MRVYLDNCVLNRPFDDQSQDRVRLETEAIRLIFDKIIDDEVELIWSYINEAENLANQNDETRVVIFEWKEIAVVEVLESEELVQNGESLMELGLGVRDALHVAAAVAGSADLFLTTDDKLVRKVRTFGGVTILNPIMALGELDEYVN